jgi:hypothetical protein
MAHAQRWNNEKIKGNGVQTTVSRTTESYDGISVGGSFHIELVSGKEGNITIKGDENIVNHIVTEVVGNKLEIHFEKNKNYSYKSEVTITVPFEEINAVSFTGSGEIHTKDTINATGFELKFTGSGDGFFDIKAKTISTVQSGSGNLTLSGTTTDLDAKISGSGNLNSSKLTTQNADTAVSGSGQIKVNCTNNLVAKVSGSGNIQYKGKPQNIDKKVSGSGDISSY